MSKSDLEYLNKRYLKNKGKKMVPKASLQFEIHVAEHCNLNCKGCDNFSPLALKSFPCFEKVAKDFTRLKELFQDRCTRILLLGGEPLLNPELPQYMELARRCFPSATVTIVTNGTMFSKMSDDFWHACRSYNIELSVSRYPVSDECYSVGEQKSKEYDICYYYNNTEPKIMYKNPFSLEKKHDANTNFILCHKANNCITLKEGKLYTCTLIPNIVHFNTYFHKDMQVLDGDGINIYEADDADQILEYLAKPTEFCKYCNLYESKFSIEWGISRKSIEEWI